MLKRKAKIEYKTKTIKPFQKNERLKNAPNFLLTLLSSRLTVLKVKFRVFFFLVNIKIDSEATTYHSNGTNLNSKLLSIVITDNKNVILHA